jgi:glycosyltransferase involved in cell wall biosynthesis
MKLVHLNYYCHHELDTPEQVIEKHKFSSGFIDFIKNKLEFISVKHMGLETAVQKDGISYHFFKSRNRFWYIPFTTHRFVRQQKPDVVLVEGFVFPLQVLFLRLALGRKCVIIAQHHAELPFKSIKRFFQKLADSAINAYIFTSAGNAKPWLEADIIRDAAKCHEVLSASTAFRHLDKQASMKKLGLSGDYNFLWVGLLNSRKNPLTVLDAFEKYGAINPMARLYMIYQANDLLPEVASRLAGSNFLKNSVHLIGRVPHEELPVWFSATDFYISGSHREGSGYALVEAISCGCLPVVTDIPSFRKITNEGKLGSLFPPGNAEALFEVLCRLPAPPRKELSKELVRYAETTLSFEAISNQLFELCLREKAHHAAG